MAETPKNNSKSNSALCKLLVKIGLTSEEQIPQQLTEGKSILTSLAESGRCDEPGTISRIAKELKIRECHIERSKMEDFLALLSLEPLSKVALAFWKEFKAVPFERSGERVVVAMANPLDHESIGALQFIMGRGFEVGIALEKDIMAVLQLREHLSQSKDLDSIIDDDEDEIVLDNSAQEADNVPQLEVTAPPVIRLVNKIFSDAVFRGASDIHLTPGVDGLAVKTRVDGIIRPLFIVPRRFRESIISRIKLLANMDIAERRRPQDGRVRIITTHGKRDLRVSSIPTAHGENVVARILPVDLGKMSFQSLGMNAADEKKLQLALRGSSKLILSAGPTGSGKTSTLYAALTSLHDGTSNIITIEDPIEYRIDGVCQMQVNSKIGVSFAAGLRSVLRQDPDVIMVGEIRDSETAAIAMQVAQTGHIVLSTIHTNSAIAAITRLRDLQIPSFLVAASLGMVIAQRLVRKLCPKCAVDLHGAELARCHDLGLDSSRKRQAGGCKECGGTGYAGRAPLFSFLTINDTVREAIRTQESELAIEKVARLEGYKSLEESGMELWRAGVTSLQELERVLGPLDASAHSLSSARKKHRRSKRGNRELQAGRTVTKTVIPPDAGTLKIDEIIITRDIMGKDDPSTCIS